MTKDRPSHGRRKYWLLRIAAVAIVLYAGGFVAFLLALPAPVEFRMLAEPADAIVALTGEGGRLRPAIALLEHGMGKRLLITGVNSATTKNELRTLLDGGPAYDCCADLDFNASDTIGNARETAEWSALYGYDSLVIVTGAYHMPRTLLEFSVQMPQLRLVPYPVTPEQENDPFSRRLLRLNGEYAKYLASRVRLYMTRPAVSS